MKKLQDLFDNAKAKSFVKVAAVGTAVMASGSAMAQDDLTATILAISTTAETNQSAIIAAVISLAAISFGVGFILRWLMK